MSDLAKEIQEKKTKKYKKRVFFLLRSLYGFFQLSPMNVQMIDQYTKIYRPLTDHADPTRLPFKSKGKFAIKQKRRDCLFAMLNHVVVQFWAYCKDQENEGVLLDALIEAEEVVKSGSLENYKVIGDDREGYRLVK